MKSLSRILFSGILLLIANQSYAQIAWNEIPAIPVNPAAGETSPQSYDVMMADDGRIYASYIFNNGSNHQIYFQEYIPGTGWTLLYNDFVYSGFEAIHSFKQGGNIFVFVKRDDAVSTPQMRLYQITSGSVSIVNDFNFSDIPDGADYRAVMSETGSFIYMLHKNISNSILKLTQFNISGTTTTALMVPTGASTAYNYDLVEHQDTVYIGLTRAESSLHFTYLHKAPLTMAGIVPHHPGNTDGQLGGVAGAIALQGMVMSKDVANHTINILTREDNGPFQYKFIPASLTTTFVPSSTSYSPKPTIPAVSLSFPATNRSIYFGSLNSTLSPTTYNTKVIQHDYTTDQTTPYSGFDFDGVADQSSNCRLAYAESLDLAVVSLYDANQSKTRYYLSNHTPVQGSAGISYTVCPTVNSSLITGLEFTDVDGQAITITDISAADGAMFPAGTLTSTLVSQAGNSTFFNIQGTPAMGGTTTITVTYTDGFTTSTSQFTVNVIVTAAAPTFTQSTISVCSNNGLVDFSDYVSEPGGTFTIGGSSTPFSGLSYNSNFTGLPYETAMQLYYTITSIGCNLTASAQLTLHESATVTVATTSTSCGGTNGTAIATIAGGTSPFLLEAWSSGETNVTSVNSLAQGTYTFTVQDANLCSVIEEFTIVPTGVDIVPTISNATCFGANNGSISVSLTGFSAPTFLIWSSGHSSTSVNNLTPGTYTATVTDASNCVYTEAFTITAPAELTAATVVTSPTCGNSDGSMEVQNIAGGISPYDVSWSSGGTNALETNVPYGVYSATITDNAGCQTIKTVFVSEQNSANLTGAITGSQCGSSTGEIDVTPIMASGQTVQAIAWSSGQTTEDLSLVPAALYICTLTTNSNCHAVKGWNIPIVAPELQPICVVTVDSLTSTNLVVWEDVQPIGIHHYNIYRETSVQGEYILIDTVNATNTSLFNDVVASPIVRSWSYKISAVNGCNVEGPLSPQHRTMHLSALYAGTSQTQISWNAYEGTAYSSFVLWKYTDANLWELAGTFPVTQVSYTDNIDFATPGLDYIVELSLDEPCSALKFMAQDFNTTRSNKDKGSFKVGEGTGDSNNELNESFLNQITLFPNPTTGVLNIEQITAKSVEITITDLTGKKILASELNTLHSTIDLNELKPGTYLVEMSLNNTKRIERIVKI
jgi:hypothetical protein